MYKLAHKDRSKINIMYYLRRTAIYSRVYNPFLSTGMGHYPDRNKTHLHYTCLSNDSSYGLSVYMISFNLHHHCLPVCRLSVSLSVCMSVGRSVRSSVRPSGLTKRHLLSILGIVSTASPIPTDPLSFLDL